MASAQALSDDLLAAEERCFRGIEQAFVDAGARPPRSLKRAGELSTLLRSETYRWAIERDLVVALLATVPVVDNLFTICGEKAEKAIGIELVICEHAAPRKAKGAALKAQDALRPQVPIMVQAAIESYGDNLERVLGTTMVEWYGQITVAMARHESKELLEKRLFSPEPLNMVGNSGRGIWWRTPTPLKAIARGVAIGLVNTVRTTGMSEMNAAATP